MRFGRVESTTTLAPLDGDVQAAHVHTIEISDRIFGTSLVVVLNKGVGALLLDIAPAEFIELSFELTGAHVLGNISDK